MTPLRNGNRFPARPTLMRLLLSLSALFFAASAYATPPIVHSPGDVHAFPGSGIRIGASKVLAVSAGYEHSLALKSDGTVWTWGDNYYGELGVNSYSAQSAVPGPVSGISGSVAISAGGDFNLVLKSDGTVWAWGDNSLGELGNGGCTGDPNSPNGASISTPAPVSGLSGIVAIAGGYGHSLALKNDGTVWAWGDNTFGELGNGTFTGEAIYCFNYVESYSIPTPGQVSGLSGVVAIAAGHDFSLAIRSDGTVWAWGDNTYGELGNGGFTGSRISMSGPFGANGYGVATPGQVNGLSGIVSIATGSDFSLAIRSDGTVWAWGENVLGQLGNGVFTGSAGSPNGTEIATPGQAVGLSGIVSITAGDAHSMAVRSDGTVWAWGDNTYGELGNGGFTGSQVMIPGPFGGTGYGVAIPGQVNGLSGIVAIAGGAIQNGGFSLAVKSNGTVWAWGDNDAGQLGNGTFTGDAIDVNGSVFYGLATPGMVVGPLSQLNNSPSPAL